MGFNQGGFNQGYQNYGQGGYNNPNYNMANLSPNYGGNQQPPISFGTNLNRKIFSNIRNYCKWSKICW